jgi:hypothetical protein
MRPASGDPHQMPNVEWELANRSPIQNGEKYMAGQRSAGPGLYDFLQ